MECNKNISLITNFTNFSGAEFQIADTTKEGEPVVLASKKLSLFGVLHLFDHLKDNLKTLGYYIQQMNIYSHYADNIDEELDEDEKHFDGDYDRYHCGGNFAFFLQTKHVVNDEIAYADNNAAGDIIKKAYTEQYPDHKMNFNTEMSHCGVSTETRAEAKQFMLWMWEQYIKPWVDAHSEGWEDFVKQYKELPEEDQTRMSQLINSW